jgi:hypothetical protein
MPQSYLPVTTPWAGVADSLQQFMAEQIASRKMAEMEAYKRQIEQRKLSQDDRALDLQAEGLKPRPVAPKDPDLVAVWQNGKQVYLPKVPGLVSDPEPKDPKPPTLRAVWRNGQQFLEPEAPGMQLGAPPKDPDKPNYVWITMPDGTQRRVVDGPGLVSSPVKKEESTASADDADRMVDEALASIKTLRDNTEGFAGAVGAPALNWRAPLNMASELWQGRPASGTPEADFAQQFESLKAKVTLPNLKMMKGMGALSDAEGKRIENASLVASRATSEQEFVRAIKEIEDTLKAATERRKGRGLGLGLDVKSGVGGSPTRRVQVTRDANGNLSVKR